MKTAYDPNDNTCQQQAAHYHPDLGATYDDHLRFVGKRCRGLPISVN